MARVVIHQPVTMDTQVFFLRLVHVEFEVDKVTLGQIFVQVLWFSACIMLPVLHIHSFTYHQCYTILSTDSNVQ
jgi:hypothetical protein